MVVLEAVSIAYDCPRIVRYCLFSAARATHVGCNRTRRRSDRFAPTFPRVDLTGRRSDGRGVEKTKTSVLVTGRARPVPSNVRMFSSASCDLSVVCRRHAARERPTDRGRREIRVNVFGGRARASRFPHTISTRNETILE